MGYTEKYIELLREIAESNAAHQQPLTAFWPMRGHHFQPGNGLMIIGRTVNRWQDWSWLPSEAEVKSNMILSDIRHISENAAKCPMTWVTEYDGIQHRYNTRRSAFWMVAKEVIQGLLGTLPSFATDWPSHLCYSNLCKISPYDGSRLPGRLWRTQLKLCIDLLRLELEVWQPSRVLVLAGDDWYNPFIQALGVDILVTLGDLVEGVGQYQGQKWILAKHPQGKRRDLFVRQSLESFR
jgi:hypothetical protein